MLDIQVSITGPKYVPVTLNEYALRAFFFVLKYAQSTRHIRLTVQMQQKHLCTI